ncbi:hypothetical protein Tco_0401980 [Tanacetum coccineum]
MRTRSQTRNRNRQQQAQPAVVEPFNLEEPFDNPPLVPMADNRTMAELLQAPTEGYEDAIVIPEINANFELKHGLINLVQPDLPRKKNLLDQDIDMGCLASKFFNQFFSLEPLPIKTNLRTRSSVQPQIVQPPVYQAQPYQAPAQQMQGVSKTDFENYVKANDVVLRNMQNQGQVITRREDLKGLLPGSGIAYTKFQIFSDSHSFSGIDDCSTLKKLSVFLALADDPTSRKLMNPIMIPEGTFLFSSSTPLIVILYPSEPRNIITRNTERILLCKVCEAKLPNLLIDEHL